MVPAEQRAIFATASKRCLENIAWCVKFFSPLSILFLASTALGQGLIYEGSSTIGENIMPEAVKVFEARTGIKFTRVGLLGSGKGFKAVMEGRASVAGMSRSLKRKEKRKKPYYQIIGYDAMAVFVNANNPIRNLSKEQIKQIFTGEITNWKEVGGRDAPIVVVTEIKTGGRATIAAFKKAILGGASFGPSKEIDKPVDCVRYVAQDENAITHASLAFNMPGVVPIAIDNIKPSLEKVKSGRYPLSRPLLLVSKGLPQGELKQFFQFMLSDEGQAIVKKHFVPVR
ncbi:MAG: phosphate ABC transporter substrate-binding protein [Nitrospinota bacterium]|nr:MAG: phosphate ABC transporter substrate-binding protein [Nitrospinota bacterium]